MKGKKNECKQYSHSNFSSKLPREVIDKAVINSVKLIDPSFKEKKKKKFKILIKMFVPSVYLAQPNFESVCINLNCE